MASQTKSAGAGTDTVGNDGTLTWSTPGNITASDDARATVSLESAEGETELTHWLRADSFGFTIPVTAVILGIVVSIERRIVSGPGSAVDSDVRLHVSGVIGGTNKSTGAAWPAADATTTFGSATDLWSRSLTPGDVNAANFGVVLAANVSDPVGAGITVAGVDHMQITVHYSEHSPRVDYVPGVLSISTTESADAPAAFIPGTDFAPSRRSIEFIPGWFFDNLTMWPF